MQDKILKLCFVVFAVTWMVIIFSEYWRYNPNYSKAIELFQYYDLLILLIGVGGVITWFLKKPRQKPIKFVNGISIFSAILFLEILAVNRFTVKEPGLSFTWNGLSSHLGHFTGVAICLFLVYLFVRVLGGIFTSIFPPNLSKGDLPLIQVALGIMVFTFFLFFLGSIGLLNPIIIIPICLIILAFNWRDTFLVFKETLLTSINIPKELNVLGIYSFLFLAVFLVLNFAQILRPFPIGADSLREYVNLSNLIAESGGLIDGHQPYNWSLFMSTGLVVFGRMDVVLALSFFGSLLSLVALFQLSKKWLNVNYSALVLLLFYSVPMVNFLSYLDMKVDMGLLFFTLSTLLLYYNWVNPNAYGIKSTEVLSLSKVRSFFKDRIPPVLIKNRLLVLIGLLSGFAFGIKLTALFFILALFCTIWFYKGSILTFITSFCLCFAAVFLLQLDSQPGLRQFHQDVSLLQWSLLGIGMTSMVFLFLKQKKKLIELLRYSAVVGIFIAVPILPWLVKNVSETGTINVSSLLNGKTASPVFDLEKVKRNSIDNGIIIPGLFQIPEREEKIGNQEELDKQKIKTQKEKKEKAEKRKNRTKNEKKEKRKKKKQKEREQKKKRAQEKREKEKKEKNNIKSSVSEDLHRFMGYEAVPIRYLSLPYDVFIKTNVTSFFVDVGFVLLLLFPFLFLFSGRKKMEWRSLLSKFTFIGISILFLIISIPSAFLNQNNLTKASDGLALLESTSSSGLLGKISDETNSFLLKIYSPLNDWLLSNITTQSTYTYPLLLLLFLLIFSIVFVRIQKHTKVTQSIILFLLMYFFLWWILGSGASWYGIILFCIPLIFLFKSISVEEKKETSNVKRNILSGSLKKSVFLSVATVWIFLAFTHRTTNYNPIDKESATRLYFSPIMKYTMGELHINKLMEYHFPSVRSIVEIINKDRSSLVYMVGTPCSYFIDENESRVLSDTFLDFFDRLIQEQKSKDQIINRLKAEGIKYIIFDLKMANYDVTPEKTLTKKFIQFLNTLYDNPQVEWLATDRRIKLNNTNEEVYGVFPDNGSIVKFGSIAIFRIK